MSDDEANWRILSSGKEESDRRAALGFPSGPADDGGGLRSDYSSGTGDSGGGSGWGSIIAAIVIIIGVGGYLLTRYVAIPVMAMIFAALFSKGGKRRRRR